MKVVVVSRLLEGDLVHLRLVDCVVFVGRPFVVVVFDLLLVVFIVVTCIVGDLLVVVLL